MIVINTVDSQYFTYNGIRYFKNFTPVVRGDNIEVVNTYDRKIMLTDAPTIYSNYVVDGNTFSSVELLQIALLPVLFTRSNLNGGGGAGGELTLVSIPYTDCTTRFSTVLHTQYITNNMAFKFDNYNNDAWVSANGVNTNQRLVFYFGGELIDVKKITYQNGFQTGGSLTPLNSTFGINNCVVRFVTSDIIPTTSYNVTNADYTDVYTGTLTQQTDTSLEHEIPLTSPPSAYAIVIDAADTHTGSLMSLRRFKVYH